MDLYSSRIEYELADGHLRVDREILIDPGVRELGSGAFHRGLLGLDDFEDRLQRCQIALDPVFVFGALEKLVFLLFGQRLELGGMVLRERDGGQHFGFGAGPWPSSCARLKPSSPVSTA